MGDGWMIVAIGDMGILATYAAKLQPRSAAALPKPPVATGGFRNVTARFNGNFAVRILWASIKSSSWFDAGSMFAYTINAC